MKNMARRLVPDSRTLCNKDSKEVSMLIWTDFESFAITYPNKWLASKISFSNRSCA